MFSGTRRANYSDDSEHLASEHVRDSKQQTSCSGHQCKHLDMKCSVGMRAPGIYTTTAPEPYEFIGFGGGGAQIIFNV